MLLLLNKNYALQNFLYFLNLKYNKTILYFKGYFGLTKRQLVYKNILNLKYWNKMFYNFIKELNYGWLTILTLSGLGFKATRKLFFLKNKYWRLNVGHSHIFQYFPPKNIILKIKNRNMIFFGFKKNQINDITQFIQLFHKPDIYKAIGIKYPYEKLKLKKGKVRQ